MIFEKIANLCAQNKIAISKLEKDCEIGNGTISKWDNSMPRIDNLKKVADYFGVPIEYFLE